MRKKNICLLHFHQIHQTLHLVPSDLLYLEDYHKKRKNLCVGEAIEYAKSIQERFNRKPKIEEFWEEFPLFMKGNEIDARLPIKQQLGSAYQHYKQHNNEYVS